MTNNWLLIKLIVIYPQPLTIKLPKKSTKKHHIPKSSSSPNSNIPSILSIPLQSSITLSKPNCNSRVYCGLDIDAPVLGHLVFDAITNALS